ncbi:MAG: non-homologous end-joining DNA ligase LigD [Sulfobacillus sp.]
MREFDSGKPINWEGIQITHPNKIVFPDLGLTRLELVAYYRKVGQLMIDHMKGRAITVKRWPHDIQGSMFYQKNVKVNGSISPIAIDEMTSLLQWVARGAIEFHVPLGLMSEPMRHDWAVLDLDPPLDAPWSQVHDGAILVSDLLDSIGVPFLLKTSGQKGVHFYVAIQPADQRQVVYWMQRLATLLVQSFPGWMTVERQRSLRGRRIYLDYLQNGFKRTMVGAYSLRALPNAAVSAPIRREELIYPPDHWTPDRVMRRVMELGDLFCPHAPRIDFGNALRQHKLIPE